MTDGPTLEVDATGLAWVVLFADGPIRQLARVNGIAVPPEAERVMAAGRQYARAERAENAAGSVGGTTSGNLHRMISIADAARDRGCSESYMRRLCRRGDVRARNIAGRWLVEVDA